MIFRRRRSFVVCAGSLSALVALALLQLPKLYFQELDDVMVPLKSRHKHQEEYIDRRGIHVVVGHYMGNDIPGKVPPNLTDEILNMNGYEPHHGAGENGQPVQISSWEASRMQLLYHVNEFNLLVSDRISVNRSLPDVRRKSCREKVYELSLLPSTSVIIVFHNEAWSTLLRTVHSVINRSPSTLLKEIILVDDASQRTFLKKPLQDYVSTLTPPVHLITSVNRTGLIRARLLGARKARGTVLTFLDAHCEVTPGWLEPILSRLAEDRRRVVTPIIDIISDDSFQYMKSFELHWGAFNWNLHFRWYPLSHREADKRRKDITEAFMSPAMAGGLFSIHKAYFYEIGAYDEKMDIWGGENLEMSFRVWMCGGSVEIAPCSHVGHVFRKSSPYSFPGDGGVGGILYRNLVRVAHVWLDDWAPFYFKMNPDAEKMEKGVNVEKRKTLRSKLGCHSFQWYLDNVWPEHFFPAKDRFFGKIRNKMKEYCLQRPQDANSNHRTGPSVIKDCVIESYPPQSFVFSPKGFIMTDESICLDSPNTDEREPQVRFMACMELDRQRWTYDDDKNRLKHIQTGLCVDLPSDAHQDTLSLQPCTDSQSQKWIFEHEDWTQRKEKYIA